MSSSSSSVSLRQSTLSFAPPPPVLPTVPSFPVNTEHWEYHENICTQEQATSWFEECCQLVTSNPKVIRIGGKEHFEHRLTGEYAKVPGVYSYSGIQRKVTGEWPSVLVALTEIAKSKCPAGTDFDTALINLYRNGHDSLSYHADADGIEYPIASYTFYPEDTNATTDEEPRDFLIKDNATAEIHRCPLANRSLIIMKPGMQSAFKHSVPERKRFKRPRINVTLRNWVRGGQQVKSEHTTTR